MSDTVNEFYLQDSRSYVGNNVLWWAKNNKGYTTDLSKAEIYPKEQAARMNATRPTDIPWPKSYIDDKVRPAVDMQYLHKNEAFDIGGLVLVTPKKKPKNVLQCCNCHKFMSERDICLCPHCGADNRP